MRYEIDEATGLGSKVLRAHSAAAGSSSKNEAYCSLAVVHVSTGNRRGQLESQEKSSLGGKGVLFMLARSRGDEDALANWTLCWNPGSYR